MFKLFRYLKNYKKEVILGPIFKLIEAFFELIVPLVMAKMIDVGIAERNVSYILSMGGIMLLLGIVGLASAFTCQYFAARASQGFGTEVRKNLYAHINTLSYSEIDRFGTPSLITRITNDVTQTQTAVAMTIRLAFRAPFLIIGATVMAMILDLQLSLVFFITAPVIGIILFVIMKLSVPRYRRIQTGLDEVSRVTRENLEGNRAIRAFAKEGSEKKRFGDASERLKKASVKVGFLSALTNPMTSAVMNLAIVAILWFGGMRVDSGDLTQGQIIAFVNYMTQILLALVVLANLVVMYTKSMASAARINEVFAEKTTIEDCKTCVQKPVANAPKIQFRNVKFRYGEKGQYALNGLDTEILQGQTIGIIGGTGSGKSTLINLIPRFYDATKGEILVDGVNVKDYPLDMLREKIGIVPQKAVLFSGTVASNLKWGKRDATEEEMYAVCETAQAAEFVSGLPDGLDAPVEQGGKNFSGGQRQRLTIARALIKRPEILILDDSASALDFATDAKLRRALTSGTSNMTVLTVSQRASAVKNADRIIVLDEGNVVGIGKHSELICNCPEYAEICNSQLSEGEGA